MTLEEALELRNGKKLVFTNGVFDILHAGHVGYLQEAKNLGEILFIGVNSDLSSRRLGKGPNRPVNTQSDRVAVLEALRAVSGAILFDEDTPENLISILKPDVHVKGGDYKVEDLPETKIVHGYGGQVVILPFLSGRSTTNILKRLGEE